MLKNLFDNEWIAVKREKAIPYYQFGTEWKLINTAVERSLIDTEIDKILSFYQKRCLNDCDIYSNEKTNFLYKLYRTQPQHHEVYHAFQIMRKFLKKQTGTKAHIYYTGNDLIWDKDGEQIRFHVCKENNYNVGGTFYKADQLKQQIENQVSFPQKEWYQSLLPFFSEKEYIRGRK